MVDDRAVALVALFLGVAGLLATLVPPLRLPGLASVDDARRVEECLRIFPDQVSACSSAG
ncbi:hypothetical protein [Nonomuraea sp. SBT364]|uniref:hypothetical protein n=1 Tax=Nonomuraea sp. SBT364 TaxID=1580530 RepID=UPI0012E1005E|nr:hypothetical protein [Nonomuraea sp. SBT364]